MTTESLGSNCESAPKNRVSESPRGTAGDCTPDSGSLFFIEPTEFLQQGDVFRLDLIGPAADWQQRIFRTSDGRHGSAAFAAGASGTVFGRETLETLLTRTTRTPLHTDPFEPTQDGQGEMVVVHAVLLRHFVLATQTCDISGVDKKDPDPFAVILPMVTLEEICRHQKLPFQHANNSCEHMTIHQYVTQVGRFLDLDAHLQPGVYADTLRGILGQWNPPKGDQCRPNVQAIKKLINETYDKGFVFPLRGDSRLGVPEGYIDFSAVYSVPRARLEAVKGHRIARIASPYRDQFAQKFAGRIQRIAVAAAIRPERV